ncbi:DUF2254 family protein [Micromonospora sp. WMMB482]|uniref:DUF2254 family protein n=1 Tax=Micromonospora sp. WMMB482 TaxID=2849653 RepID=UPI0020B30D63|nr:DUF2254 family protein [Micromonospora sp. WMMB482]
MVEHVDLDRLAALAREHDCALSVLPAPGDFVVAGQPLIAVHPLSGGALPCGRAGGAGVRRGEPRRRTDLGQDVGFGFRQLTDIAERALSPGINDTTTAVRSVQEMHDLLRPWPAGPVTACSSTIPTAHHAYGRGRRTSTASSRSRGDDDVRRAGRDQPRITRLLDDVLADLRSVALPEHLPDITRRTVHREA